MCLNGPKFAGPEIVSSAVSFKPKPEPFLASVYVWHVALTVGPTSREFSHKNVGPMSKNLADF